MPRAIAARACASVSMRLRQLHPHVVAVDPHGIGRHGGAARREQALPRAHVEHPAVPRAGQAVAGETAFAERAAAMRAGVGERMDAVADADEDETRVVGDHEVRRARRDLRQRGRADYFHRLASPAAAARTALTDSPRLRLRLALPSHIFLEDVRAMEPAHVLPAHLRRLPHLLERLRLALGRGRVPLDDLVAALAVDFVGLDVDREELHLVVAEAVVLLERREIALVDAGDLRLEPDEEPRRRDVERRARGLVAPGRECPRGGELASRQHLLAADPARFAEADEQVDVLHAALLLDDVLEQEIARVGVRASREDGRAPLRELANVLEVLAHPLAQLLPRQLAVDPRVRERVHAAVPRVDGVLELGAECAGHDVLPVAMITQRRRSKISVCSQRPNGPSRSESNPCVTPVPRSPANISAASRIHGARGARQTTIVRSALTKLHARMSTTDEMPLARSAADVACASGDVASPSTSGRSRWNHAAHGPGFIKSPSTTRVSTPVKNGLQFFACAGIGRPASGPFAGATSAPPGGVESASVLRKSPVQRATDLSPWSSEASSVCAFLPSRSTATAVVIRSRVTGRHRSKLRRASIIPSGTGARTSKPP